MNPKDIFSSDQVKNAQYKILFNLPFWIAAGVVALVSVFYNRLFKVCEEWALSHATVVVWTAPLALLVSFLAGHFFSKEALGSGIPQVIASVELSEKENPTLKRLLSFPMLVTKIIGSSLCVLGGGVSGREGPTLQISAAVFYQFSRFWPTKLPKPSLPAMILAGGAAGLASAFNTPLGGVVFAMEELAKTHVSLIRTAVFQAVIIAGILAQLFLGNYLYLGSTDFGQFPLEVFFQTILVAALIGLVGSFFAESLYRVTQWRNKKPFWMKVFLTVSFGICLSLTIWLCGPETLGAGKGVMQDLLKNPEGVINPFLAVGRIFGNFFTYIGGVVGGIFAPALASGAALGQALSGLFGFASTKLMIIVGMVAFLTGITRTPFTSFVLVLEMSNSHEIILYLMLSSVVANLTARLVSTESFYEKVAHALTHPKAVEH